jgi:hypothetical protein
LDSYNYFIRVVGLLLEWVFKWQGVSTGFNTCWGSNSGDNLGWLSTQGVHCSNTVNIHVRAQKGYYLEQACTKCTYKRHISIKQEVDIHEAGDKAIEKYM